jgi:hypothetical protein
VAQSFFQVDPRFKKISLWIRDFGPSQSHSITMMRFLSLSVGLLGLVSQVSADASDYSKSLQDLDYRVYPLRSEAEAAVLEWGHSAIISALDASVANFGPQTAQAALLEVEAQPVLASPVNGLWDDEDVEYNDEEEPVKKIRALANADEVHGNMVVMTNTGEFSGVEMATIAQKSGAAALLVVNVDEDRPDDIHRLPAEEGSGEIDIPVVMISLNSANVLTSASVSPRMKRSQIVNNGMPDRVRLYAGGDRPFFEDVEATEPTIYLIHNLLTKEECDSFVEQAKPLVSPVTKNDALQLTHDWHKFEGIERVMLWQGMLLWPARKAIEERIEQVTGFPSSHYSDFVIDKIEKGGHWKAHYDTFPGITNNVPMASITIFLTDDHKGGEAVYPSTEDKPVKVLPRRGLAVVHHNTDDRREFDVNSVHALLPVTEGTLYVARKYIFAEPVSHARRIALPVFALPFGGKLPTPFIRLYRYLTVKFDYEQGGAYFDKVCIFVPLLLILGCVQIIVDYVRGKSSSSNKKKKD